MASQPPSMDLKYYIDLVVKRRWVVMVPFFVAMIAGSYLSITLPKIYESSTLILIQPQRVPQSYVQSIVDADPGERISTLSQQVLSRTNLEKIIDEFKLFTDSRYSAMYTEDKVADLRKRIAVSISSDRRRASDAFTISFQDKDPQLAMRVTSALASFFINENLRIREAQAVGTSDFLDAELQSMKTRLEEVESQLKAYRESYMGELPEQLESNLRILDRLQGHLGDRERGLSEARIRLATLQSSAAAMRDQPAPGALGRDGRPELSELDQLRAQLDSLLTRYTERHPDVVRLRISIAELERQAQATDAAALADAGGDATPTEPATVLTREYITQRNEITRQIGMLERDIQEAQRQIATYQKRVENTPKREQELLSLRRDYENVQSTYNSLLARKLEAEIAVNMERKQQGEQFRVLDPAKLPQNPVKPDMRKLFILVLGAGLAVGGGIVFLLEYLDQSFKRPDDIEAELSLPVLCTIPQIVGRKTVILRRLEHVACALFGLVSVLLLAGFAALTQKGVEPTLELVRKIVNL